MKIVKFMYLQKGSRLASVYMVAIVIAMIAVPITLQAKEQYIYEVSGAYANSEDEGNVSKYNAFQVNGSIYDSPVGYGDYPYLLTNYFERRTRIEFNYAAAEVETGSDKDQGDSYRLNYAFAGVASPVLFNIGVSRSTAADVNDPAAGFEVDSTALEFGFGYYITRNSTTGISIQTIQSELSKDGFEDIDVDEIRVELNWDHVVKTGTETYVAVRMNVEAIEIESSHDSDVGVSIDFYINKRVGLGVGFSSYEGDSGALEGSTITLNASAFVNKQFGFRVKIGQFSADLPDSDVDSYFIEAITRFM